MAVATGVYPYDEGYRPVGGLNPVYSALPTQVFGALAARSSGGTSFVFAGTGTDLYLSSSTTFSNVSSSAGVYNATNGNPWEMAQYGDTILAVDGNDNLQFYTFNSSTKFATVTASATSFPSPNHIAVIRDFVVLGSANNLERLVGWSAIYDFTSWTIGTNQCDSQQMPDGGNIQRITGGEFGLIWQSRAITRMTYVGPPLIFRFDKISHNMGLLAPGAVALAGGNYYFWSDRGFFVTDGASEPQAVGYGKVDEWLKNNFNYLGQVNMSSAVDPVNKLIFFAFVSVNSGNNHIPDTLLIYNYQKQEFSIASISTEYLVTPFIKSSGTGPYLAAFDTSHRLCDFTGSNIAATLTTSDFEPNPGNRACVTSLFPLTDTSAATGIVQYRERPESSFNNSASAAMQSNGEIPVIQSGAFFRAQISIPSSTSWTYINGIDIDAQPDGEL